MNFTSYKVWGAKFTPTKLKCLVAPPKGEQLFVIEFLWCINLFSVWINLFFFFRFSSLFRKLFEPTYFILVQNLTKFEKKRKNTIFGHKITNMNQISFVLYWKFYWMYVLFLFIWEFLTILWLFLASLGQKVLKMEKVAKNSKKMAQSIFFYYTRKIRTYRTFGENLGLFGRF